MKGGKIRWIRMDENVTNLGDSCGQNGRALVCLFVISVSRNRCIYVLSNIHKYYFLTCES